MAALTLSAWAFAPLTAFWLVGIGTQTAFAQCSQNGSTENCTGNAGIAVFGASSISDLEVGTPASGGSLTQNLEQVSLTGAGASPGTGQSLHYTCQSGHTCTITLGNNSPDTCTSANNNAYCIISGSAGAGPTGNAGPTVTVNVLTGNYTIVPGDIAPNGVIAGVQGVSHGSNGGNGGNAYVFGGAGNGSPGANGGLVQVTVSGNVNTGNNVNDSGVVAISTAGNGGNGGNAYVIGGSAGNGGAGGYGGDATAQLTSGTVQTGGANAVGVGAFTQGGNGGNGGGGGGLVYSAGGGNVAGEAGTATASTGANTIIITTGDYAYGVEARSLGGGGGSGGGGFGAFYSGGGNGSTGGNGGQVIVMTNGLIQTSGVAATGILAQSIGGGGGDASTVIGLVALGGNGGGGGEGGTVNVTNSGQVTTTNNYANAIEAQSIGGGGGNGASSGGLVALGGNGAGATTGGQVQVSNTGTLQTSGIQAVGILAQSIGGGGGNGGTAGSPLFAMGGSGGNGADGGTVTVSNGGNITTGGSQLSPGILAQSIGGGGGNGGGAISAGLLGVNVSLGGSGGSGGAGQTVQVLLDNSNSALANFYSISTAGSNSSGVVAQSVGGGGGNGGFAVSVSPGYLFGVAIGVAGNGGPGGGAGTVEADTKGTISTSGINSDGILAQSIGGGGGNGGFAVAASAGAIGVSAAVGGQGGIGGSASGVTVNSLSSISTQGVNSSGILAQSIGGGGGNGGFAGAASIGLLAVSVGVGGSGGSGGAAGEVLVDNTGNISTVGSNSAGIVAQSLGGGGGQGGFSASGAIGVAAVTVGVGGSGGGGQSANTASIDNFGAIYTQGDNSAGLLAQSIGGGGGNGGFAVGFSLSASVIVPSAAFAVTVGGSGGAGSNAADVSVTSVGQAGLATPYASHFDLVTTGQISSGIVAQSLGGGGGNGGFSVAFSASANFTEDGAASVSVGVGGSGGSGGNGSSVYVNSTHNILTTGVQSNGILAQSIGGGGGQGGFAVSGAFTLDEASAGVGIGGSGSGGGEAGAVTVDSYGVANANQTGALLVSPTAGVITLETLGEQSNGILAQSIGGGGGNGGFSVAVGAALTGAAGGVSIGGSGAAGGSASTVNVTSYNNILTMGDKSDGISAQSIGGGGGNGGFSIGLSGGSEFAGSVSVGGFGAGGGNAAAVTVNQYGSIATQGDDSNGIAAQSIGGGGGNGGFSVAGSFTVGAAGIGISVGGFGGGGGNADAVTVNTYAAAANGAGIGTSAALGTVTLSTVGDRSNGILAQSVGGGGGNGGFSVAGAAAAGGAGISLSVGGFGGGAGNAGAVNVTSYQNIQTQGANSDGILAQSIGGKGGNGGFSLGLSAGSEFAGSVSVGGFGGGGGSASAVTVDSYGTVATQGDDSNGIAAQSLGGGGGNGGFSVSGGFSLGVAGIGISVGGFGGGGGASDTVTVDTYATAANGAGIETTQAIGIATLSTVGDRSNGILAQSIGGGGGNGGFSIAGALGTGGAGVALSVGGFAGGAGNGSAVVVTSYQNISTQGALANGILAQSIGGAGGNGGFSIGVSAGSEFAGSASVGGFGGGGGNASTVIVNSFGTISTVGDNSNGIAAQSIGGGGGNGGFSVAGGFTVGETAALGLSVGGFAGTGGAADDVTVDSYASSVAGTATLTAPAAGTFTIATAGNNSNGILAQSLGGGGGNGGFSASAAFADAGAAISASVGGFGGGGGNAGSVNVTSVQNIMTVGNNSNGIAAMSIGGGGGNGGFALGLAAGSEFAGAFDVGGFGAQAGNASSVTVNSTGEFLTEGTNSNGILAQSIGGAGGNGGFALSGTLAIDGAVSAAVGGFGGTAGYGSAVVVNSNVGTTLANNNATIETDGQSANGIEAQSIGGGGGNGGFSGSFAATLEDRATVSLSVGGFGAAGNTAGTVNVTSVDNILTKGDGSNGILAQSIGGGGGSGGFSFAGTLAIGEGNSFNMSASLGGFGGSGGDANTVTVNSTGVIETMGNNANGVSAQSIGGGGGNGGLSVAGTFSFASENNVPSITASVGGVGGSGGAGGAVNVTRNGNTITAGDSSVGILAQSIGGGGGNGGLSIAGSIGGTDSKQISASVGGFGGAGSNSGDVTVINTGSITTGSIVLTQIQIAAPGQVFITVPVEYGNGSDGILAQSIGGGGGNGGFAFSGSVGPTGENMSLNVGLTVGGTGGSGGTSGLASVTNNGLITTYGANANGIEAQSLGGGGGNGGSALTGQIAAGNPQAGGNAVNVAISVGGEGGTGNDAGAVYVNQTGGIVTYGGASNGILAQSIGGGGGNGGGANSLSLQLATSCTLTIPGAPQIGNCEAPKKPSINAQVDVGGFGGTGGNGNTVTVINNSYITTYGSTSSGIMAQSIGGGGGNGGQAIIGVTGLFPDANYVDIGTTVATLPIQTTGLVQGIGKITVGGSGGAGGDGSTVMVTNSGVIQTAGDTSYGIEAQSLGGGGGNGGNAESGVTGALSIGGFGNASGKGGDVTVTNNAGADITTTGLASDAIFAQSVGGGGGNGGTAGGLIAIGGFGGASGGGGTVEVDNNAALQTSGDLAIGILAQSIGGGGGNGGGTGLSAVAIGGLAGVLGSTGDGGAVTVRNSSTATIVTSGLGADGIEAQSIGGGGGNGGGNTLAAAVTVGGHGGSSGAGGYVQVFNDGQIQTTGLFAIGIFAQSIGGSGGAGGGSIVSAVTVGGFGGSSGAGGQVDVTNTNLVMTSGLGSDAIRAQSIGGGGGDAGGVNQSVTNGGLGLGLLVSVGGSGGGGGNGGAVNVTNSGILHTAGDVSNGIYAQSVGGGGGNGGTAIGLVAIGGAGGNTGIGGAVTVNNNVGGQILTTGILSDDIFAQSVGGGGGTGGGAYSGSPIGASTSVGGSGAAGGAGGTVLVNNYAVLEADGASSEGVFAQSVGGGGGNGGVAGSFNAQALPAPGAGVSIGGNGGGGGSGGAVTVNNYAGGTILMNGIYATGIFAQSVGGGGGTGGYAITTSVAVAGSVAVSVGGNGGAGGDGGDVTVTNAGLITMNGKNSLGIMAQSVGGGGGVAADSFGVAVVPVSIGGQNGATGVGGNVSVTNTGSIVINGNNSIGIFAQSVGGGGGMVLPGGGATAVVMESGGTGNGGTVTINNTAGSIIINGDNSVAIYSQSIGGGGGTVGANTAAQIGAFLFSGTAGGVGAALSTTLNQTGSLVATGMNSTAVVAQSDAPDGNGNITVNINNPANTTSLILGGLGSGAGVSIMNGANNALNNNGVIAALPTIPGTSTITAVSWQHGTFTVVAQDNSVSTVSGIGGYAVLGSDGNDAVNNNNLIIGSVDLGAGVNSFNNTPTTAVFDMGTVVNLGADANLMTNNGLVSPGGYDNVLTTAVTGSMSQSATGYYGTDLDLKNVIADRINLTGTAAVSGFVTLNLVDGATAATYAIPGTHDITILSAAGGETHSGLSLIAPQTAVSTYSLTYPTNGTDIDLTYVIDYSPAGLTPNEHAVGNAINAIQTAQISPNFRPIASALFFSPNAATLAQTYDSLSGEGTAAAQQTAFMANDLFMSTIARQTDFWLSDDNSDPSGITLYGDHPLGYADDQKGHPAFSALDKGPALAPLPPPRTWRVWFAGTSGYESSPGSLAVGSAASKQSGGQAEMGIDFQISPNYLIGLAGGFGKFGWGVADRATFGTNDASHIALYGAARFGNFYTKGILGNDFFGNNYTRYAGIPGVTIPQPGGMTIVIPGFTQQFFGNYRSDSISGYFETGYKYHFADNYELQPFGALQFSSLTSNSYDEFAVGAPATSIGLAYNARTIGSVPVMLGTELRAKYALGEDVSLTAWARAAWRHELLDDRSIEASFLTAPGFNFIVNGAEPPRDALRASVGGKLDIARNVSLYASFVSDFSPSSHTYSGSGGIRVAW